MKAFLLAMFSFLIISCSEDNKKRGVDYNQFKTQVKLTPEQEKSFNEITAKYQKQQEQNFEAAKAQGGKMDRVALGIKNEELRAKQAEEMSTVLDAEQMGKFNKFVDENSRKRPRYNNQVLERIKTELQLSEEQFAMLNAANDAFEKSFNDAHDVYHGNNDLAKEYWEKFDGQRKEALKKVFTSEQYAKFLEIVKDQHFKGRK
ncbi:hypothetical protein [Chryseobacterium sp. JUb7]|uniref:hypothetical protein n=1 Tax=Chryseobacterium sp. JUb7 TaxID=2940599 RepID=UPI0021686FE7|nr:hypothetical protein [Chryseobacterium sp. JUb7]MCS3531018.1 Spy/CpxP family protein refolding chaperone [Chryseobacterium sp. JUb7]